MSMSISMSISMGGFQCSSILFSTKFISPGDSVILSYDPRYLMLSSEGSSSTLSKVYRSLPGASSMNQIQKRISMKTWLHMSSPLSKNDSGNLHVNKEACDVKFPAIAVLLTNTLFLANPLEALAETCEADNSFFNMPLLLLVAVIGATVGGLVARQRKGELQKLNEQLRQINAALRRQAKIESYAPNLSYAPATASARIPETEVIVDPKKDELISHLKAGKNYLRNLDPEKAFTEFQIALELAKNLNDPIEEKKAARGLGASLQRQGKYREAIKYHNMVLGISKRVGDSSGNTEAYGAIADCYTELGELEKAGKFYDNYIARLED